MWESLTRRRDPDIERMVEAVLPDLLLSALAEGFLFLGAGVLWRCRRRRRRLTSSFTPTAKGRLDLLLQPRNAADLCFILKRIQINDPENETKPEATNWEIDSAAHRHFWHDWSNKTLQLTTRHYHQGVNGRSTRVILLFLRLSFGIPEVLEKKRKQESGMRREKKKRNWECRKRDRQGAQRSPRPLITRTSLCPTNYRSIYGQNLLTFLSILLPNSSVYARP